MAEKKAIYLGDNQAYIEKFLETARPGFSTKILTSSSSIEEILREIQDADFCLLGRRTPEEVYRASKQLKLIQTISTGYEFVPLPLLRELGIPVANMEGVHSVTVAEHAVTLMLMVLRKILPSIRAMEAGKWRGTLDESLYAELYQKTVGIVGLGNIGRWTGRIVSGFGAQVIFYNRSHVPQTVSGLISARKVSLKELLRTSDIVNLSVALNPATQGMINKKEFALMKPSSILINTCRGKVVDETALIEALQQHRIGGAGLDTFEKEPLDANNPLLHMDQVVCTPHIGGSAWENVDRRMNRVWDNFEAVLRGERPIGLLG